MNSKFGNFNMRQFMVKIMSEREREREKEVRKTRVPKWDTSMI